MHKLMAKILTAPILDKQKRRACREILLHGIIDCEKRLKEQEETISYLQEHFDITQMKPAQGQLREHQLKLVQFAADFFEEIKELNINPFLVCGNLLGYVRHNGFIPWDDDLDFGLFREDYEKLIDYCSKKYAVCTYHGKLKEYDEVEVYKRLRNRCNQYPNQYVLDIFYNQLQLSRGGRLEEQLYVDFWCFDFFDENYTFADYSKYLEHVHRKAFKMKYIDEIADFLRHEALNNPHIVKKSSKVYFSPDCAMSYTKNNDDFIDADIMLPLKQVVYEGKTFLIPNQPKKYLFYEFKNYMNFPKDMIVEAHEKGKKQLLSLLTEDKK